MTVYEQLLKIRSEKMEQGRFPTYALVKELDYKNKKVRKEITKLSEAGKIRIGQAINSYFIELL